MTSSISIPDRACCCVSSQNRTGAEVDFAREVRGKNLTYGLYQGYTGGKKPALPEDVNSSCLSANSSGSLRSSNRSAARSSGSYHNFVAYVDVRSPVPSSSNLRNL